MSHLDFHGGGPYAMTKVLHPFILLNGGSGVLQGSASSLEGGGSFAAYDFNGLTLPVECIPMTWTSNIAVLFPALT